MFLLVNVSNHHCTDRPYYGWGAPPPQPHGYPPGPPPPGHPPHMYPQVPGVMFYPVHPAYFYPYPAAPPPDGGAVTVVDGTEPEDMLPELPGETVELPWSKSGLGFRI